MILLGKIDYGICLCYIINLTVFLLLLLEKILQIVNLMYYFTIVITNTYCEFM